MQRRIIKDNTQKNKLLNEEKIDILLKEKNSKKQKMK